MISSDLSGFLKQDLKGMPRSEKKAAQKSPKVKSGVQKIKSGVQKVKSTSKKVAKGQTEFTKRQKNVRTADFSQKKSI